MSWQDRCERAATALLLQSPITALATEPKKLETGRQILFDSWAGYCARTGQSRYALTEGGPLPDGCTLRINDLYLVLTDDAGAAGARRRRFTQAHELGHILLEHETDGPQQEREADRFASALLLPAPALCEFWRQGSRPTAGQLADWFFVSISAARTRLAQLTAQGSCRWGEAEQALARRYAPLVAAALADRHTVTV